MASRHTLQRVLGSKPLTLHTLEFQAAVATAYADMAILRAGEAMAFTGYDVIYDPEFLEAMRAEFITGLGHAPGRKWRGKH